jgi:hypothetical protein
MVDVPPRSNMNAVPTTASTSTTAAPIAMGRVANRAPTGPDAVTAAGTALGVGFDSGAETNVVACDGPLSGGRSVVVRSASLSRFSRLRSARSSAAV